MDITNLSTATVQVQMTAEDLKTFAVEVINEYVAAMQHEQDEATRRADEQRQHDEDFKTLLSCNEVATRLKVTRPTLFRWEKSQYLVPVRVGSKVMYHLSDIKRIEGGRNV